MGPAGCTDLFVADCTDLFVAGCTDLFVVGCTDLFVGGICLICLGLLRKLEMGIRSGGSTDNTCKNREATFNPSLIIIGN